MTDATTKGMWTAKCNHRVLVDEVCDTCEKCLDCCDGCEVCGYHAKSNTVVWEDIDGVKRCEVCRQKIRYGKYFHDDNEEMEADNKGLYTDEWKLIMEEYAE